MRAVQPLGHLLGRQKFLEEAKFLWGLCWYE